MRSKLELKLGPFVLSMLGKVCRCCGRSNICDKSKNLFEVGNGKLVRNIRMLTGLLLQNSPDAPSFICLCCHSDLNRGMSFRKLCIKTQKKWQRRKTNNEDYSQSEQESSSPSATPTPILQSSKECNPILKAESTYRESEFDEEPQKIVEILIKESKIINHLDRTNLQNLECDHLADDIFIKATKTIDAEETEQLKTKFEPVVLQSSKDCKRLFKLQPEAAIYICELCGTHANTKASFQRHIRKHTGERPFACKVCTARFLSAGELRAHELKHTGERPFPCRFCDRRYISYMGRLKHERMHTNQRPFVCEECGKAFTSADILRNHMLVHTGERLFRCEYCDRSFQRKTHLRTHFRSNTHKQNEEKKSPEIEISENT